MKLYEITEQIRQALQMVADGEIPEDQMQDTLEALGIEFDDKVDNTAAVIRELEAESDAIKGEMERLANMKKVRDGHVDRLKDYLRLEMARTGKTKVKGKLFTVSLGKASQIVQVTGEVDEKYQVVKISEDKALLKADLTSGREVKGAELVSGKTRLLIK